MKELHFDVEIITRSRCQIFPDCEIALVKRYRGIDCLTLEKIIHDIRTADNNDKVTINIRGVTY